MLFYYLFSSLGLCYILKYSALLNTLRDILKNNSKILSELFNCSMCLGFWCGVVITPLLYKDETYNMVYFLYPFVSSSFCWTMDILMDTMVAIINISKEEHKEVSQKLL
jgi:hypothetical protein